MKSTIKKRISKPLDDSPKMSKELKNEVLQFIEYHPAKRFSRNLRSLILEFLQTPGAPEILYFEDLFYDFEGLFILLDRFQAEKKKQKALTDLRPGKRSSSRLK